MSLRPEESLCSSLCNPWTWPYISMPLQGAEHGARGGNGCSRPLTQLRPWPVPRDTACQGGKKPGSVWPGREGRPEFLSFPLWLFQDFFSRSLYRMGWAVYQSQILAGSFPGRSFWPRSPRAERADRTYLCKPSTARPDRRADSGPLRETAGTANPPTGGQPLDFI